MNIYPRESVEFQGVRLVDDTGGDVVANVEFAVTELNERPTVWMPPFPLDGQIGFMVMNRAPGTWKVWARITANPEVMVLDCGNFIVE